MKTFRVSLILLLLSVTFITGRAIGRQRAEKEVYLTLTAAPSTTATPAVPISVTQIPVVITVVVTTTPNPPNDFLDPLCRRGLMDREKNLLSAPNGLEILTLEAYVRLKPGETKEIIRFRSIGSGGFQFCGYPEPVGKDAGIYWGLWSGAINPGQVMAVKISVPDCCVKPGVYEGWTTLMDLDSTQRIEIRTRIEVVP
ncbi:hypothetical protein HY409_01875 [Candidatus Gottesmanbacteria bacterium]|nr:hypothetical protein [Candidatus Gottesmanbacteria bacterium]